MIDRRAAVIATCRARAAVAWSGEPVKGETDDEQLQYRGRGRRGDLRPGHLRGLGLVLAAGGQLLGVRPRDLPGPLLARLDGLRGLPGARTLTCRSSRDLRRDGTFGPSGRRAVSLRS